MSAHALPEAELAALLSALRAQAHPEHARQMAAYMRDQFAFFGIPAVPRRQLCAAFIRQQRPHAQLMDIARLLFDQAERECAYVACDLLRRQAKHLRTSDLSTLLQWARQGAWWDVVDPMAQVIGQVVRRDDRAIAAMDAALVHEDLWTRRVAMLHQLGWRLDTDTERLWRYALTLAPERDFFVRKAIGWALRDYARWAPDAVRAFLQGHHDSWSPLTLREAGKHL